jgi:hypothetical protein
MSLPKRGVIPFSRLYKWESGVIVSLGVPILSDLQTVGGTVGQEDFYSFQWWYKDYPKEILSIVHLGNLGGSVPVVKIVFTPEPEYTTEYPENFVGSYDPDTDPVPDPNGDPGETTAESINGSVPDFAFPRWHTSTAYDLSSDPDTYVNMVPPLEFDYGVTVGGSALGGTTTNYPRDSYSMKVTTPANESEVINENTGDPEYYPFAQATLTYEKEAKFKVVYDGKICCWNKGATIKGKVAYSTIELIATAVESPPDSGYGYGGMQIETGNAYTSYIEADWEVVVEDDFEPPEIVIPKVDGKAVFINDFWVTEVVKPA